MASRRRLCTGMLKLAILRQLVSAGALTFAYVTMIGSAPAFPATSSSYFATDHRCLGRGISPHQISFQLHSYSAWKQEIGTEGVLAEIAAIGYRNIEPYEGSYEGRSAVEFSALVSSHDMKVPSSHGSIREDAFSELIQKSKTLRQEYVGSGGAAHPGIDSLNETLQTARTLNRLGQRSVESGTGKIFVHNHRKEFTTIYPHPASGISTTAWELLEEFTDPRFVTFELDVLWAADAGVDVAQLIKDHGIRIELLHVKDGLLNGTKPAIPMDVGYGDIEWGPILDAARKHVRYYVVERDSAQPNPRFASNSFGFLTCHSP